MHDFSANLGILKLGDIDIFWADTRKFKGCT
jgi:hypothetical protein